LLPPLLLLRLPDGSRGRSDEPVLLPAIMVVVVVVNMTVICQRQGIRLVSRHFR
jgi:hypothetical protein